MIINFLIGIFTEFIITIPSIGSNTLSIIFKDTSIVNDAKVVFL